MKKFTKDIQNKSPKELEKLLEEKRVALSTFRFGSAGSNARNVKEGATLRKNIARILTVLNKTEAK